MSSIETYFPTLCHWKVKTVLILQLITVMLHTQHGDSERCCADIEHWTSSLSIVRQQMADKKQACVLTTPALDCSRQVQLFSFTYCIKATGCNIFTHCRVLLWPHLKWWQTWRIKTNYCDSPYYTAWYGTRVHPSWLSQ